MKIKKSGVRNNGLGVSPVIGVILMVAITVVLAGMVYYWVGTLASTTEEDITYVGFQKKAQSENWLITINRVQGPQIPLDEINFKIVNNNGVVKYSRGISDANPQPFFVEQGRVYPIADNSSGAVSSKTLLPVTPDDGFLDYVGAIIVYIDNDDNGYLSVNDVIRIYGDFNDDGDLDIVAGHYFKIKHNSSSELYVNSQL